MRRDLFIVAAIAMGVVILVGGCTSSGDPAGKNIYFAGQGHAGPIPRSTLGGPPVTGGRACANCHGPGGQGGGIGPSITRATLGSKHTVTHKPSAADPNPQPVTEGPWTTQQTVDVVRTGVTPEGQRLGGLMPTWQLDSQDAAALAVFLGQL